MSDGRALFENGNKIIPTVECLIVYKGKVLLMKRSETSKNFPGYWIGPGGHVDSDEDYLSAAIREVKEETGVNVDSENIRLKVVAIGNHKDRKETYIVLYFLIHLSEDQELIMSEEGGVYWIPLEEVSKMDKLFPPFKFYIEHALKEKSGIMYTNVELENLEIINVLSKRVDKDY